MSTTPRFLPVLCCAVLSHFGYAQNNDPRFLRVSTMGIGGGPGTGPGAVAANFIVQGGNPLRVLIRAAGPSLFPLGVTGFLADPILTLYDGRGVRVAANDNWGGGTTLANALAAVGAAPFIGANSRDAALLVDVPPGIYTAVVSGAGGTTGMVQLDVYEAASATTGGMRYVGARGLVGPAKTSLTVGAELGPATLTSNISVLFRGLGPALAAIGVSGTVPDPVLTVNRGAVELGVNDNWSTVTANTAIFAGLMPIPLESRDSALALSLPPAGYVAGVTDATGGSGVGMLEITRYEQSPTSLAPGLLVPPYPVAGVPGGNVILSAVAVGYPPPGYRWRKDGVEIGGQSSARLQLSNLTATSAGNYSVILTGNTSVTSLDFPVTVGPPLTLPTILTQPTSRTVVVGTPTTFSVVAGGTQPLGYQWSFNGVPIAGASSSTLAIASVQTTNVGSYTVQVANAQGTVTSMAATLATGSPPSITTEPASLSVFSGTVATFTIVATGDMPLTYQWRRNGVNIPGATSTTLTVAPARLSDAGNYTCVVSNVVASVTSRVATLAVQPTYAGTYFGTFVGTPGSWAMVVRTDGIGTFVGFVNNPRGGIILTLRVGVDGRFRIPGELIRPQPATGVADPIRFTLAGAIDGADRVSGSLEGLGLTLSGAKEAFSTETAAYRGIYQATGTNGSTTILVVGSARQVMALLIYPTTFVGALGAGFRSRVPGVPPVAAVTSGPTNVEGALGTAESDGSLAVRTSSGTTLNARVNQETDIVTGTVAPATEPIFLISGSETEGLGPPVIMSASAAQTVLFNSRVAFTVEVAGKTPFTFQWRKDGAEIASATAATYVITAAQGAHAGSYTCAISNSEGDTLTLGMQLTVGPPTARLVNLSIRTQLTSATDNFTLGFVLGGDDSLPAKPLLIRAAGPSLAALDVQNPVSDPKLEFFGDEIKSGENDDWGGSAALAAAMAGVGAFSYASPTSKDAAILAAVTTRKNMAVVSATGPGVVVAELYDASAFDPAARRLINISVRKPIGTRLTAGFVIGGTGRKTVLVRAVGPGLAAFGVGDAIENPQLVLTGDKIASRANDDWGGTSELVAAFSAAGAFELGAASRDAALVATLEPGQYYVDVTSVNNANGSCLIEIYDLDF